MAQTVKHMPAMQKTQVQFLGQEDPLEKGMAMISHPGVSDCLQAHGLQPARLLCPWDSPGKNTRVGCHALLQGIFPTKGLNSGLLHCRWILYCLSHQGSPRILEKVALSLLQGIFLTQELNWSLLHCRQILYQLSHQGSPVKSV